MGFRFRLPRFARDDSGVAAVEFALVLPIMLLIYIGTVEASALVSTDRRVQSVTGALGDLVARSKSTLSGSKLTDYFQAARGIMTPYRADDLIQVVSEIRVNADRSAEVVWSRQYVGGTYGPGDSYESGDPFPLPDAMIDVALDNFVIVSQTIYPSYTPIFGVVFDKPVQLERENFYMPRFGGSITVND